MPEADVLVGVMLKLADSQAAQAAATEAQASATRESGEKQASAIRGMTSEIKEGRRERDRWQVAMEKHTAAAQIRADIDKEAADQVKAQRTWIREQIEKVTPYDLLRLLITTALLAGAAKIGLDFQEVLTRFPEVTDVAVPD